MSGEAFCQDKADYRVLFTLDFKQTRVSDRNVQFFGFRLGAQKKNNVISVGYYGLARPQVYENQELLIDNSFDTIDVSLDINYTVLGFERIFFQNDKWQISVPAAVGLGNVRTRIWNMARQDFEIFNEREALVGQGSVRVGYAIKFWLHAQAAAGQRFVFTRDRLTDQAYSGFTWMVGVGVKTGALIKHWRSKRKL